MVTAVSLDGYSCVSAVCMQMVTAIQVMRIYLLELEKVQDLCKDFCNRYITSLKSKLQSDILLSDSDSEDPPTPNSQVSSSFTLAL